MKRFAILLLSAALISFFCARANAQPSNRVQVYAISQSYWDVAPGETLGEIVKQLLPDNMGLRKALQSKIIELNPNAFSRSNPDNLKANVRLWLPNNAPAMQQVKNKQKYEVKSFSWGQVYKPKR